MDDLRRRRRAVLVVDRAGYRRYTDGPFGSVLPNDQFAVHLVSTERPELPRRQQVETCVVVSGDEDPFDAARRLARQVGPIDAVVTVREQDLGAAASLRADLGALGLTVAQTERFRDKVTMKRHLADFGVTVPRHAPFTAAAAHALLRDTSAVVIKPRDGSGSVGIHVASTHDEIDRLANSLDGPASTEVEEYVPGALHHVDSIVRSGRVVAATVSRYLDPTTSFTGGTSVLRSVTLAPGPSADALLAMNTAVIESHPYLSGVTHLEAFVTPTGQVVFCEVAARVGGGAVAPAFFAHSGIDLYATHIRAQAGILPPTSAPLFELFSGWVLVYAGPGEMTNPPHVSCQPWLLEPDIYIPEDGILGSPGDVSQAVVTVAVTGPDPATVEDRLNQVVEQVQGSMIVVPHP